MSSPHVAGAAALLLQSAPRTPAQAVGRILQNSASPKNWSGNPGLGFLDFVHRQGAGMLRIDDAVTVATRIEPGKLSLGEGESGPSSHAIKLQNSGSTAVTYTLSSVNSLATGANTFAPDAFLVGANTVFNTGSVTLQPGANATVGVTITPPATLAGGQYGGYLVFTPDDGSATLRVPFAGYIGDYQLRQVLVPTANGFPWLAKLSGASYTNQAGGASYSMAGNDVPFFLIHFDHQPRLVRMDVVDAVSGRSWHRALQMEYLGRNSSATGFFAFSWDGVTTAGKKSYTVPQRSVRGEAVGAQGAGRWVQSGALGALGLPGGNGRALNQSGSAGIACRPGQARAVLPCRAACDGAAAKTPTVELVPMWGRDKKLLKVAHSPG